jgi:uncharacterized protein
MIRYTNLSLPAYRYVPGQSPHPTRDPDGHSFGKKNRVSQRLTKENWRTSTTYLFGIDLFNAGYYWEAHETWEQLWKLENQKSITALFLQGLIQISAGALKARLQNEEGRLRLQTIGMEKLHLVQSKVDCPYLGVDLTNFSASQTHIELIDYQPDS